MISDFQAQGRAEQVVRVRDFLLTNSTPIRRFAVFMHKVIEKFGPGTLELQEEAQRQGEGLIYILLTYEHRRGRRTSRKRTSLARL